MAIWVEPAARLALIQEAERAYPSETGGLLIGYAAEGAVVVTRVVGPGPAAVHGPDSFAPDDEYHASTIEAVFAETEGSEWYLGDWHTHPDGGLYLSRKDFSVLTKIANCPSSGLTYPIMLVISVGDTFGFAAWTYRKRWFRPSADPCELILE